MSTKFIPSQFNIKGESEKQAEARVVKWDTPTKPVVRDFQIGQIRESGQGDYASTKARFGALAATDVDRAARSQKDSRFTINPLLRDPLSVEEEERRVIEERVRDRIAAVQDEAREQASKLGFEEGLKRGHDEAFKIFQEESADRLAQFELFLAQCDQAKTEIFEANESYLVELVFRIARMVTLKELSVDRDYVVRVAREILDKMGVRENIRLKIGQKDFENASMIKEGLERTFGTLKNLNIEVSPQIQNGGCLVETEFNAVDASIDTQLHGIHESLKGGAPS